MFNIKRKYNNVVRLIESREYNKIIALILGKRISILTNTMKPQKYKYVMLATHGVGRTALWNFLSICKMYPMKQFDMLRADRISFLSWRKIYGIVVDRDISNVKNNLIMINKLSKRVPVFCLVRDPISIILCGYNMTLSYRVVDNTKHVSIKDILEYYLEIHNTHRYHFMFTTLPKIFNNITSQLVYIDTNDLSKDNAYATMKKCCEMIMGGGYDIEPYKEHLSKKIADSISVNLERSIHMKKDSVMPFDIEIKIITYENTIGKNLIVLDNIKTQYFPDKTISICVDNRLKRKIKSLKNSNVMERIQMTVIDYIGKLKYKLDEYEKLKISELDILEYFKNDKNLYNKFFKILTYEVSNVEKHAPHIVGNWNFYKQFLKINNEN